MKRLLPTLVVLLSVASASRAADLSGPADVLDGETLKVEGATLHLAGIAAPPLDQWCLRNGREIPCGVIARGALLDLVTGSEVFCRLTGTTFRDLPDAVCSAGGFEVNANMIYTGWALPLPGAGHERTRDGAREDRRGLWATSYVRDPL